ncbi:MAG: Scramblase [Acidobacteria bacterium ADurb.Bin340]|nr:MAG: Scramblase [Acidobacteria bacterium ADurb.Bin340]HQL47125.1 phospholipid scramblase-related protein [Holophaga sp.]
MLFDRNALFVREKVAFAKLTDTYELFDPATQMTVGEVRDEPSAWAKWFRLLVNKSLMPTRFQVYESGRPDPVLTVVKHPQFLRPRMEVHFLGRLLARFQGRIFSWRHVFDVLDPVSGQPMAELRGDWKGWNFQVLGPDGRARAVITKKWSGLGRELFTTADAYMVALAEGASADPSGLALALAAAIALDAARKDQKQ